MEKKNLTLKTTLIDLLSDYSVQGINIMIMSDESFGGKFQFHNLSAEHPKWYTKTITEIALEYGFSIPYKITRGKDVLLDVTN